VETVRTHSSWFGSASKRGAGLVEIDDFPVEPELVKVTAGRFESARGIEAAGLQRVETGSANQALDGGRRNVVVRGVEEDGSTWLSKGSSRQRLGGKRPERLDVMRRCWKQAGDD
jgi:hypothetical protein